jgi:hypothetical protein
MELQIKVFPVDLQMNEENGNGGERNEEKKTE